MSRCRDPQLQAGENHLKYLFSIIQLKCPAEVGSQWEKHHKVKHPRVSVEYVFIIECYWTKAKQAIIVGFYLFYKRVKIFANLKLRVAIPGHNCKWVES